MKIRFRCNLDDVMKSETFPDDLPEVPRIGDLITSSTKHGQVQVQLRVVGITWEQQSDKKWAPIVELGLKNYFLHVAHWEIWYDFVRGKILQQTYDARMTDVFRTTEIKKISINLKGTDYAALKFCIEKEIEFTKEY